MIHFVHVLFSLSWLRTTITSTNNKNHLLSSRHIISPRTPFGPVHSSSRQFLRPASSKKTNCSPTTSSFALNMFQSQVTFFYTSNLEDTARFYQEKLGLSLSLDQGTCRIYRVSPAAHIGFCTRETTKSSSSWTDGVILTLVTPDVDRWADKLESLGVTLEKPPTYNEKYNIYHLFFRDPNGYLIEIQRFEDPKWKD